jgi:hypothetical protein
MKIRWRLQAVLLVAIVLITGSAYGQRFYQMQAHGSLIEVLSQEVFEATFGDNTHIPRTERSIIALAEKLYPPLMHKMQPAAPAEEIAEDCGEEDVGVLFAALQNPAVSDSTRKMVNDIIVAAIPPLPKVKYSASGHFKIYYTTNNANPIHNVTDAQIDSLATLLDSYWNSYAASFKDPKYKLVGGKKRIDVKVYYISANTLGQTASGWDHIELNSSSCVQNACKRRTTSAHELFHRVQYAYGYVSGTANLKWIVEGTAAWSQKFTNQSYRDYMARMNSGLNSPNTALITGRSYDACHFWTYLQEQASSSAIKQVWAKYQVNGLKAKEAVGSITSARLGLNFDKFAAKWSKANYIKDLTNAITGGYDYDENAVTKTSCGVVYGPLNKVPVIAGTINANSNFSQNGSVTPYGAKYHVFTLGATLKDLAVNFKGTGSFEVAFIGIKGNAWKSITNTAATTYNYKKTLTAGQWDKLAVMVMGTTTAGNYTLKVGSCIAGEWTDGYFTWKLTENGSTITGTVEGPCGGTRAVTGTYTAPNITLKASYTGSNTNCCAFTYTGTVTDCKSISGTWKNNGCSGQTGTFSMTKSESDIEPAEINPNQWPRPGGN